MGLNMTKTYCGVPGIKYRHFLLDECAKIEQIRVFVPFWGDYGVKEGGLVHLKTQRLHDRY